MHGMRGEVSVIVKVELFSDVNKFRQSSCGVHFFSSKFSFYYYIFLIVTPILFLVSSINSLWLQNTVCPGICEGIGCE